ncbi:MAG: tRNA pseudouridine(38-40) synthase TruA [bacterium]|nr:tRNA pseudouridine(38-40) synthase TruA [bacterium]
MKLTIEYEGTHYHGWQIQPNGVTVQETIERVLATLTRQRPKLICAGRTDAGVHAEGQVAHLKTETVMGVKRLQKGMNALLPDDIVIIGVEEVADDFHARYSALGKTYRYVILNRAYPSVFQRNRCWQIGVPLDLGAMRQGAAHLLGRHDFSSFQASDCGARHPRRDLREIAIEAEGPWIRIYVTADAFLKHMVRNMVGTLVDVGRGKTGAAEIPAMLAARDRTRSGATAPACGLFLASVDYP